MIAGLLLSLSIEITSNLTNFLLIAGFLKKVFSILSVQLLATTLVSALFMYTSAIKGFVQQRLVKI